ncbi:MAG: UMP kinase [Eubacteriales bacterium]|nr:UMP kinase [Eubacteriales bacterium]
MYKSALIKLSGEALSGGDSILDGEILRKIAAQIKKCVNDGINIAVVIGAGNIWRGARQNKISVERVKADHMGMLGTLINCIGMQDYLEKEGVEASVLSAVPVEQFCETYSQEKARRYMNEGRVVLLACGVGYPFFSTDTGMMLRAAELNVDIVLSARAVDGVYDKDPNRYPDAVKYDRLGYDTMLENNLQVMDQTAAALGRDNKIKVLLFSLADPDNIHRVMCGESIGTVIE